MPIHKNLADWCRSQRDMLQRQLELMETGKMTIGERGPDGISVDATAQTIERLKTALAELNQLLDQP